MSATAVPRCRLGISGAGVWSGTALVAEVTYDRGLVCLAARYGIDVSPRNFAHPKIERQRLEFELLRRNVDLTVEGLRPKSAGSHGIPTPQLRDVRGGPGQMSGNPKCRN